MNHNIDHNSIYNKIDPFDISRHVKYIRLCMSLIPSRFTYLDSSRVMLLFFLVSGLDLLNSLSSLSHEEVCDIIEWIYSLQLLPVNGQNKHCGFVGSEVNGTNKDKEIMESGYLESHIAMTYTALCILIILGDNLQRVDKKSIIAALSYLQYPDGAVRCSSNDSESDLRYMFCSCCISYFLSDWSGIDSDKMCKYILQCQSYDGGFGLSPYSEGHGGSTYCAISSLYLLNKLDQLNQSQKHRLIHWLVNRQNQGFNGRPNKDNDTCYSFWILSTLHILGVSDYNHIPSNRYFSLLCQKNPLIGGFSKLSDIDCISDPLHTYYSLCGLSLMNEPNLLSLEPSLCLSQRAINEFKKKKEAKIL